MTTSTLTRLTLSPMIDSAIARFPVGERAVKAAELLLAGKAQRVTDDAQGRDQWAVYGDAKDTNGHPIPYTVSIKAGTCGCRDLAAPRSPSGQKLCKHMLACMYALKAGISAPATATGLIAQVLAGAETVVKLYVREEWTGDQNGLQKDLLHAYRLDNAEERVNLAQAVDVSMNQHAFYESLDAAGWERSKRYASHGGMHVWELTPKPVAVDWPLPTAQDTAQPKTLATALFAQTVLNRDEDGELWA